MMNYSLLDRPEVLSVIFHPRPELGPAPIDGHINDHLIQVEKEIHVGARFHLASAKGANLLFFHGNGEIVADYDQLGPLYNNLGINFLPVDYRGYGRSSGRPTISNMMADCHAIFDYVRRWMADNGHSGPLITMGRSLGSACALELVAGHADQIDGLIIESGFAYIAPLLHLLGVNPDALGLEQRDGFANTEKIANFPGPTLIIHAEHDPIIPFSDGMAHYKASTAQDKSLLKIENAHHNDILMRGLDDYLQAIQRLVDRIGRQNRQRIRNED
jgi:alpha-beta hydrolase superfamily lysophospholipase